MRILTVDIGNSAVKAGVYDGLDLLHSVAGVGIDADGVEGMLDFWSVDGIAVCRVGEDPTGIIGRMLSLGLPAVVLDPQTPLPIKVDYDTRQTLGPDRIAAAVGVAAEDKVSLLVDAGTAVTLDLVEGMAFRGGNISPGLRLRFASLHNYTSRLPLVGPDGALPLVGHSTETAIRAGVVGGLAGEITHLYRTLQARYRALGLILCGGDAPLLTPLLAEAGLNPETDPQAVGKGLVKIFNHLHTPQP